MTQEKTKDTNSMRTEHTSKEILIHTHSHTAKEYQVNGTESHTSLEKDEYFPSDYRSSGLQPKFPLKMKILPKNDSNVNVYPKYFRENHIITHHQVWRATMENLLAEMSISNASKVAHNLGKTAYLEPCMLNILSALMCTCENSI